MKQTRVQTTKRRRGHAAMDEDFVLPSARPGQVARETDRVVALIDGALQATR